MIHKRIGTVNTYVFALALIGGGRCLAGLVGWADSAHPAWSLTTILLWCCYWLLNEWHNREKKRYDATFREARQAYERTEARIRAERFRQRERIRQEADEARRERRRATDTAYAGANHYLAVNRRMRLLGIDKTATRTDLKKAWRDACKKYHPDHNPHPNAADMFRAVNEAYQYLDRKLAE